jgi:hypothetical protein
MLGIFVFIPMMMSDIHNDIIADLYTAYSFLLNFVSFQVS